MISDAHTHNLDATDAIINAPLQDFAPEEGKFYSVGLHPWLTASSGRNTLGSIAEMAKNPQVVAIGETGIDKLRGADAEAQERVFLFHVELSETLRKPLIIHEVKSLDAILRLHRELRPSMPWIRHGFRGNAHTARSLFSRGIYLSVGERFNPEAVAAIPGELLLLETDESALPIAEIAALAASARGENPMQLMEAATANLTKILANR